MIPNAVDTVEVKSNITGQTGKFSVDENAHTKLMGVLTNLYADPEGAVVREYLTNALDAQIEAQENDPNYVWRPIEVSTPSHFSKSYVVRDFGTGMSVEDITEVYSKYGKSTKETSNSVTGMLGLGSKCALTYTNQFTIVGIKNGVKCKAVVSKDEADIPVFMVVDTRATDEPNGVEISVPVRDRNSFTEKTANFLRFWKDGQVLVDGKEPKKHGYTEVKPGVFLVQSNGGYYDRPQSYVVMGNVPYQVDEEYVDSGLREANMGYVAYVDMGAIDFPPSREKLMMTTRTKKAVTSISDGLFEAILKEKIDEITSAGTFKDAFDKWISLPHHFSRHNKAQNLKYKGHDFPGHRGMMHQHMHLDWDWQGHGQITERTWIQQHAITQEPLVVTGVVQGAKPTSYFKKKVKQYIDEQGLTCDGALLVNDDIDNAWLDHLPRIDMETIKALKLPRNVGTGPRAEAPYEYHINDAGTITGYSDLVINVPKGFTVCYISPSDMRETYRKHGTNAVDLLRRLGENVVLVTLAKNRFEKFLRTYPTAVKAGKVYQERINALVAATTDAEVMVNTLSDNVRQYLKAADKAEVNDPDLVDLINAVKGHKSGKTPYEEASDLHQWSRRADISTNLPDRKEPKGKNVVKRYPLLDTYHYGRNNKHLTYYVNAVYAAEVAPKP